MLHLYSKGCEYAIQALTTISRKECRDGFSIRSVCEKAEIPEFFTRKVFQALVKNRVLTAKRGPGGGYRFNKNPEKVSILSIIHAIDGKQVFDRCVIKNVRCEDEEHCSLHPMWMRTRADLIKQLEKRTVAELIVRS